MARERPGKARPVPTASAWHNFYGLEPKVSKGIIGVPAATWWLNRAQQGAHAFQPRTCLSSRRSREPV